MSELLCVHLPWVHRPTSFGIAAHSSRARALKPRMAPKTFRRWGSLFVLSSEHWTKNFQCKNSVTLTFKFMMYRR